MLIENKVNKLMRFEANMFKIMSHKNVSETFYLKIILLSTLTQG